MRAALPDINEVGRCDPCGGKRPPCQSCSNMKRKIECRVSSKQYNGSTVTKFRARANNYRSMHRSFWKEQTLSNQALNQKRFQEHYLQNDHNGICDWEITIIDLAETENSLWQKELYWHTKSRTYAPFDLNERGIFAAY